VTNNRVVIVCTLAWVVFLPVLIGAQQAGRILYLLDFLNAGGFTFGWLVLWRYTPAALRAARDAFMGRRLLGRGAMLVIGIVKTWAAMLVRTHALWWWRWVGEPDGGLDSIPMAIAAALILGGGACHVVASAMKEDAFDVPPLSARMLWGALIASLVLGAVIAGARWSNELRAIL
jgi:hypothetical protein